MDTKTLIEQIAIRTNRNIEDTTALMDGFTAITREICCNMDTLAVPGFGSFETKERAERITVHPGTGKRLLIPPKITLRFKPSALLKQKMK